MTHRCLLDMDGVLVDFVQGVFALRGEPTPEKLEWDFILPHEWARFDRDFWRSLHPTPFATEVVEAAEFAFGSENVCILTSPCNTPGCADGKLEWLGDHFPQFVRERRFLIGPAKEFCAGPGSFLVDDYDANVAKFRKSGGGAVLVPQPWNSKRGEPVGAAIHSVRALVNQRPS